MAVDTPEYNSGATAADTLYAGIPIVHFPGNKAVGRMLSAMLNAVRLPQLIVRDRDDYREVRCRVPRKQRLGSDLSGLQGAAFALPW